MSSTNGQTPAKRRRWPLLLIAAPAAVAVWSGWVGLGQKCGFGPVRPFPGINDGFRLNTAITLPVGMEAYGAYALGVWLGPGGVPAAARSFARRSAIGALALGMAGQVIYHLLAAAHATRAPWPVVVLVSCLPVATLGLGAALTHLLRAGDATATEDAALPATAEPAASHEPGHLAATVPAIPEPPAQPDPGQIPATEPAIPAAITAPAGEPGPQPSDGPEVAAAEASEPATALRRPAPASQPRRPAATAAGDPGEARLIRSARKAYRDSLPTGKPLSDRALGAKYGQSRTWGAKRIAEVKDGPKLARAQ